MTSRRQKLPNRFSLTIRTFQLIFTFGKTSKTNKLSFPVSSSGPYLQELVLSKEYIEVSSHIFTRWPHVVIEVVNNTHSHLYCLCALAHPIVHPSALYTSGHSPPFIVPFTHSPSHSMHVLPSLFHHHSPPVCLFVWYCFMVRSTV